MYWKQKLSHIKIKVEDDSIQNNLTLSHISFAFDILLCCLPFTIATLFIEIFSFFYKLRKIGANDLPKADHQNVNEIINSSRK